MHVPATSSKAGEEKARRPSFAISLPTSPFTVSAYAEAWKYEDDEDMFGLDDEVLEARLRGERPDPNAHAKGIKGEKEKSVGVVERKGNTTVVGGEVVIGKEARGGVEFNMLVSFTYRSDDPGPADSVTASPTKTKGGSGSGMETFAFYTVVDLGIIVLKEVRHNIIDEII